MSEPSVQHQSSGQTSEGTPRFDGDTYIHDRDHSRLAAQLGRVKAAISDGAWYTLHDISLITNSPEASCSARLRDLRKPQFGGHTIARQFVTRGLYRYRWVQPVQEAVS